MSIETYAFRRGTIYKACAAAVAEIHQAADELIEAHRHLLPTDAESLIFLKPNLNNDLNALTGNSTDLRLLGGVVRALQRRGYHNIAIGDGANCSAFHDEIDVLGRLRVKHMAEVMGAGSVDLNRAPGREAVVDGRRIKLPEILDRCQLFINMPTIKTHMEAALSGATKNLMGCVQGMDKRKLHWNLARGLIALNQHLRPQLHLVDGLIVMEGDGPGLGTPRNLGAIIAGTDNYLVDAFCARLVGVECEDIPYLAMAMEQGLLDDEDVRQMAQNVGIEQQVVKARWGLLGRLFMNNWFILPRYWRILDGMASSRAASTILVGLGLRQDVYEAADCQIEELKLSRIEECEACRRCVAYCPMSLDLLGDPSLLGGVECIECLYCYLVCPHGAITVKGRLAYLEPHLARYKALIEAL